MTVEMGILHRESGEYEVVPVAATETFRTVWRPAAERLGWEFVPLFSGGALTPVPADLIQQIIAEVKILQQWAAAQPDGEYLVHRCTGILSAFERTDPSEYEYDFG